MYKLLIADDEPYIANSLAKVYPWSDFGYTVDFVCYDGQSIIDYVNSSKVDVILSDIKMTNVTGIDVARYIYEHNIDTKIVLISAYKEFDLAKDAIKYSVSDYLMKPSEIEEVKSVFTKLKAELDERNEHISSMNIQIVDEQLINQIYKDVFSGVIVDHELINQRISVISSEFDFEKTPCCVFIVSGNMNLSNLCRIDEYINTNKKFKYAKDIFKFIPLYSVENMFAYISVMRSNCQASLTMVKYKSILNDIIASYISMHKSTFSISLRLNYIEIFDNIFSCVHSNLANNIISNLTSSINANKQSYLSKIRNIAKRIEEKNYDYALLSINNLFEEVNYQLSLARSISFSFLAEVRMMLPKNEIITYISLIHNSDNSTELNNLLRSLLVVIQESNKVGKIDDLVDQVISYIDNNYSQDIYLGGVAESFDVSESHLSRVFKKVTGKSFTNYLTSVRMEKAVGLLAYEELKMYEISEKVGFSSVHYFYKLFRSRYGCTPIEYRNRFYMK